jgi:hypothetical protein
LPSAIPELETPPASDSVHQEKSIGTHHGLERSPFGWVADTQEKEETVIAPER